MSQIDKNIRAIQQLERTVRNHGLAVALLSELLHKLTQRISRLELKEKACSSNQP